jgi:FkbM family methyltransferase
MITAIPHRRPFLGKLQTSVLKRHVRLVRWLAHMQGRSKAPIACRYFGADFVVMPGEVVAFEPDGQNFARLSENIERNGLAGVAAVRPVAAGAARGTASLVPGTPENSGLPRLDDDGLVTVEVIALDDELDIRNGTICIKIDVEGYELEVLAGAVNLFRSNGGYAQIEGHGDKRAAEVTAIMSDYGWRFIDRHHADPLFVRVIGSEGTDTPTP